MRRDCLAPVTGQAGWPRARLAASGLAVLAAWLAPACDSGTSTALIKVNQASISGRVWMDLEGDGLEDAPGLAGLAIVLRDSSQVQVARELTDGLGAYAFGTLAKGQYSVEIESLPPGLLVTVCGGVPLAGGGPCGPVDVSLPDNNSQQPGIDFGLAGTGAIGDRVWTDVDCNGLQDVGEPGLEGARVVLRQAGLPDRERITAGDGSYRFTFLFAGDYSVFVDDLTLGACYYPAPCASGGGALDSNCQPAGVSLPENDSQDLTIDFGYCSNGTGSIGDFVWRDLNHDGLQQPGEPGVPGLCVELCDTAGRVLQRTWTDADGRYLFDFLCAGDYVARTAQGSCFLPTACEIGPDPALDSNCDPALVTLAGNASRDRSIDFGFVDVGAGSIGDLVWNDLDADGRQDPGEPGLGGVRVALEDPAGQLLALQTTAADGTYRFESLCAGTYRVDVDVAPLGPDWVASPSMVGVKESEDSNGSPAVVVLARNDSRDATVDFGYYLASPTSGLPVAHWSADPSTWPSPYAFDTACADVFRDAFPDDTLLGALRRPGPGRAALGRQAVAALLNSASPDVRYPLTTEEVAALCVQACSDDAACAELERLLAGLNQPGGERE